jgi:ABC-type uncharacterized transport system permease subunit
MSTLFHLFPVVAVVLYLAASVSYARDLSSDARNIGDAYGRQILAAGLLCQLVALLFDELALLFWQIKVASGFQLVPSFPYTLSLISCLLVGGFLLLERRLRLDALGAFVAPLALGMMVFSGVLFHFGSGSAPELVSGDALLLLHISLTILGHVAFAFACGVSLALILQESLLKSKRFSAIGRKLPSLRLLDRLNRNLLVGGFFCMLSGVAVGFYFGALRDVMVFDRSWRVFWTLVTLAIYAALVTGMLSRGLRGSRAAWLSVAGFCSVLISFVAVHVVGGGFHVH